MATWPERLEMARNEAVVMGRWNGFVAPTDWRNPVLPRSADGTCALNLAEFARVWAICEPSPTGLVYGFDVEDGRGRSCWRVLLTPGSDLSRYEDFVRRYQCTPEQMRPWVPLNHVDSARRLQTLRQRIRMLRERAAVNPADSLPLPPGFLAHVFVLAGGARLPLTVALYSPSAIVRKTLTPSAEPDMEATTEGAVRCFDEAGSGLHVITGALGGLWLWRGECACCQKRQWSLEAALPDGTLALSIQAATPAQEPAWRELLELLMPVVLA